MSDIKPAATSNSRKALTSVQERLVSPPKDCRRLAEADFPIAVVSAHAARENSIQEGHPKTLHLWWARRPLAACRAVLLSLLLPDPCDENCPREFKERARELLPLVQGSVGPGNEGIRKALLKFVGDCASWDLSFNARYLEVARGLVMAAYGGETPLVVDPFAGGGSIPLEAVRLGAEAFASDLNPVACLILKAMLEDIPTGGRELGKELRDIGAALRKQAQTTLAEFYPLDPDGSVPLAYIWARTVRCEAPACGAEIPLVQSFSLRKKRGQSVALRYSVVRPRGETPRIEMEIFRPKSEDEIPPPTVRRAKATCPCCKAVLPPERVRAQLRSQHGGADPLFDTSGLRVGGAQLLVVVVSCRGESEKAYRLATARDYAAVHAAHLAVGKLPSGKVPDEPLPLMSGTFNVPIYGINTWGRLFTKRQQLSLVRLYDLASASRNTAVAELSVLSLWKVLRYCNTLAKWRHNEGSETVAAALGLQALPMSWTFPEMVPWNSDAGGIEDSVETVAKAVEGLSGLPKRSQIALADATAHPLPDQSCAVWMTDPPYYFAVPYADLSDFFFVWLKRALPGHALLRDPFDRSNVLTPKREELCEMAHWDLERYSHKDKKFFEDGMARAFREGLRILKPEGIGCVVFAHSTTEAWEALLGGLIKGGWVLTSSWPVETERRSRLRARESAALATSVHLVCRPRSAEATVGDWAQVLRELPTRVSEWMERLQGEGVRGADLVFACIGPALEIYSRYSKVVDAEEREILLGGDPEATEPHKRGYLAYVWEVVGRTALAQVLGQAEAGARNGVARALEEDARLTALFLWTLQITSGNGAPEGEGEAEEVEEEQEETGSRIKPQGLSLPFDVVRRFAQPLGIHLPDWEGRIVETDKGVVYLIPVGARGQQLFGEEGARAVADRLEQAKGAQVQLRLFSEAAADASGVRDGKRKRHATDAAIRDEQLQAHRGATTLDRVHVAMLLQQSGRTTALRHLLKVEIERGPEFMRLANALSALYPGQSDEKRLLDAMLLAAPK